MHERYVFDYAVVRVVPRVDRGEFLNAGVILFCATRGYLDARIELDRDRLKILAPSIDIGVVESYLEAIPKSVPEAAIPARSKSSAARALPLAGRSTQHRHQHPTYTPACTKIRRPHWRTLRETRARAKINHRSPAPARSAARAHRATRRAPPRAETRHRLVRRPTAS